MKPVKTLVVLASEAEARLLVNEGPGKGLSELAGLRADEFPEIDQEFTDTPGRQSAAPGMARHGFEAHETLREARRTAFARIILEAVDEAWKQGGYDRIILAAAPKLLGNLRGIMPKAMADAVVAELPKDLVKIPLGSLSNHFDDVAAF